MKAKLILETEDIHDSHQLVNVLNVGLFQCFLHDWEEHMRKNYKYSDNTSTSWDQVREDYYNLKKESGISALEEVGGDI